MSARLRNERRAEVVRAALSDVGVDPPLIYVNAFGDVMVSKPELVEPDLLWRAYCIAYRAEPEDMDVPACRRCFVASLTDPRVRCTTDIAGCTSADAFTRDCRGDS